MCSLQQEITLGMVLIAQTDILGSYFSHVVLLCTAMVKCMDVNAVMALWQNQLPVPCAAEDPYQMFPYYMERCNRLCLVYSAFLISFLISSDSNSATN